MGRWSGSRHLYGSINILFYETVMSLMSTTPAFTLNCCWCSTELDKFEADNFKRFTEIMSKILHRKSKKGDTILLSISLLNFDRFSQFFHRSTQLEICNKSINKDPTSPRMCCYTTLWNVNVRKSSDFLPVVDGFGRRVKAGMHSLNIRRSWREN